jgi:hypothetical protein
VAWVAASASIACARPSIPSPTPSPADAWALTAQYVVPRPAAPEAAQMRFGGLSGLASLRDGRELLAVADDRDYPRVFDLRVDDMSDRFRIRTAGVIYLEAAAGAPSKLDPEGIAVARDGHMLITSEGVANEEPRLPPSILEYSRRGAFVRQLPVRSRYSPNERGEHTVGVRENAAFEALALTPDYSRLFTATELPLMQDGDSDAFTAGGRSRVLEYVATGGTYEPRREFAYELEPMERPPFEVRLAITGIVELLSLGGDEFFAMERGFAESTDRKQSVNRIRMYRVDLAGATDISSFDSLRSAGPIVPVKKKLVLDVNQLPGLAPPLTLLDNFEGMAWGPPRSGGRRSLILVSDDNFSDRQMTAFLLLRPEQLRGVH